MPHTKTQTTASTKAGKPLHIMVLQRLQPGVGPGPIHVVKKVLKPVEMGSTVKEVRVPVYLDHALPAGTCVLTPGDRRAFAEQGLSAQEIAYVEGKLPDKKLKSDAHQAAFDAGKASRLREKRTERLIAEFSADSALAAAVIAGLGNPSPKDASSMAQTAPPKPVLSLSEKVSSLLALITEVGRDIQAYKEAAKVGRSFDHERLGAMLNDNAMRDWKLCWFAFSRMVEQASRTPFARTNGWAKDPELCQLAAAHGYRAGPPVATP